MKKRYLLSGIALLVLICVFFWFNPEQLWNIVDFSKHRSCTVQGGEWKVEGDLLHRGYCYREYSDGGKPCISNNDCQGNCYLPDGWLMGDEQHPKNEQGFIIGECVENSRLKDCFTVQNIPEPITTAPRIGQCFDRFD